jgi:hypothetical protein
MLASAMKTNLKSETNDEPTQRSSRDGNPDSDQWVRISEAARQVVNDARSRMLVGAAGPVKAAAPVPVQACRGPGRARK